MMAAKQTRQSPWLEEEGLVFFVWMYLFPSRAVISGLILPGYLLACSILDSDFSGSPLPSEGFLYTNNGANAVSSRLQRSYW